MSRPTSQKLEPHVLQAIREIEEFYKLGIAFTDEGAYGERRIADLAGDLEINEDTLRKARAFADEAKGYSRHELRELFEHLKSHEYRNPKWKFGRTHIIRLLSVPRLRDKRNRLQKRVINNEWSCSKLEDEIRRVYGTRKNGGRQRSVPSDRKGLLSLIEHECDCWKRWCRRLHGSSRGKAPVRKLPPDIQAKLEHIEKLVDDLRKAASEAHRPVRKPDDT